MPDRRRSEYPIRWRRDYFLTQRVKPHPEDYADRLVKHHAVIVAAMKAKQNADAAHADALEALAPYYPEHEH